MKRSALLATGGTIACRQTPDGLTPALRASQMLHSVPCRADVEIIPKDVFSMDSSNIQPEEWSLLARATDEAMRECDGVVITGGPGNPADYEAIADEIRQVCQKHLPVMGIGLGHQLIAKSQGAEIVKHHAGHRGSNQPIEDANTAILKALGEQV